MSGPAAPRWGWLDHVLAAVATAVPFGVALSRAASSGQWRDDLPAVRDLGLVAVGVGGGVSTVVTQTLGLLPLGPRPFRAALGSAIAIAIASRLLFGVVRRALASASPSPKLAAVLAWIATLTAALAPTWQREATVGGGAMVATALALGALSFGLPLAWTPRKLALGDAVDARAFVAFGALVGATVAESPPAGLAVVAAVGAARFVQGRGAEGARAWPDRPMIFAGLAAAGVGLLFVAPLVLRPLAPRAFADVGRVLSASSLSALDVAGTRTSALTAWTQEIGVVSLAIAAAGAGFAVLRPGTRAVIAPFLAAVALDTLWPARAAGVLAADPWSAVRALAIASITLASALGVHEVVSALLRARIPMAKSASVLVVMFHLTLVALTSEEAGFAADRSEQTGAEGWTDEAFGRLPPASAVLVRSPALAWRLWAARITRGERPDVLVIPVPLLDRGSVAASLMSRRHETEPLLRSFALTGEPSEFALSKLADVHPLHVELDRGWSKRLVGHLTAAGLWLEYAPQPLGPSDRKSGSRNALAPVQRVLAAISGAAVPDPPTAAIVAETLRGHASVLAALGDGAAADQFLDRASELGDHDAFVATRQLPYALKGVKRAFARRREAEAEATKQQLAAQAAQAAAAREAVRAARPKRRR